MNNKQGTLSQILRLSNEKNYRVRSFVSTTRALKTSLLLLGLLLSVSAAQTQTQTTSFTYQGRLTDAGAPANANYDLQFTLWDAAVGGTPQPQPAPAALTKTNVAVTVGVFSVLLDFGVSSFPGADRFLEVGVRPGGAAVAFTLLSPRQQISSTPYALRTLNATAADSLSNACVGCVTDTQINSVAASKLTGTLPGSSVPAGGSFIQNTTAPQANANFNIGGNGFIGGNGIIGGNVGIGTSLPAHRLEVLTPSGSYGFVHSTPGNILLGIRPIKVGSFAGADSSGTSGGWLGTLSNHPLHFFVNGAGPSMTINTNGNVGIGTTNPPFKLTVDGGGKAGVFVTSRNGQAVTGISGSDVGVFGQSASSAGVWGDGKLNGVVGNSSSGDGVVGNSSTGSGVRGFSSTGYAMFADGNTGQRRDKGGWVKAMAFVEIHKKTAFSEPVPITRCYNAITGADSNGCGFAATSDGQNSSTVDFGFKVDDRFIVITPVTGALETIWPTIVRVNGNRVLVNTFAQCGSNCGEGQRSYFIIVY